MSSTRPLSSQRVDTWRLSEWMHILESLGIDYIDESEVLTPADAALMMQLGPDGNFVGSGSFKSSDPMKRARAFVAATTYFKDFKVLAEVSRDLGEAMPGLDIKTIVPEERMQDRGW